MDPQIKITKLLLEAEEIAIENKLPHVACFDKDQKIIISEKDGSARHALEILDKEINN